MSSLLKIPISIVVPPSEPTMILDNEVGNELDTQVFYVKPNADPFGLIPTVKRPVPRLESDDSLIPIPVPESDVANRVHSHHGKFILYKRK